MTAASAMKRTVRANGQRGTTVRWLCPSHAITGEAVALPAPNPRMARR